MATKTVTRILFVFGFLLISCSSSDSKHPDNDVTLFATHGVKFPHSAFEKGFHSVLRILSTILRLFPIEHDMKRHLNLINLLDTAAHWKSNLITILRAITGLTREGHYHPQQLVHHGHYGSEDRGHYSGPYHSHHVGYHSSRRNSRGVKLPNVFDVISKLFNKNVLHLGFEAMSAVQSLIMHLYRTFFGSIQNLGHVPRYPDIIQNIIKVSQFDSPGELLHPGGRHHRSASSSSSHSSSSSSSSSASSSSASSPESSSEEQIPEAFIREFTNLVSENNPLTNPSKLLSLAQSVCSSNIFKDLESAFEKVTGIDVEGPGPVLRATQVGDWVQKIVLPAFMQFSNLLNVPVPEFDLESFI
ncbi:unnamed protein product [Allacma fusca]|uniref:Uncharacterized protein n=1 Tax=Allacma fusca TaxID=39272 RepID=A0A8J2NV68_9HEXA|nr:unnamed protein product [Allacma fusca]